MLELDFVTRMPNFTLEAAAQLPDSGVTALLGPSGCGKTTLAASIAGLRKEAAGLIRVGGRTFLSTAENISLPAPERGIGFVFQNHRLFPHLSVLNNLRFGITAGRRQPLADEKTLVDALGIDALLERRPDTLSGGESQRVALGRAVLAAETLLIMDEPLASLDEARRLELLDYFERIRAVATIPVLYITHAREEAERLADTVVELRAGKILSVTHR